MSFPFEPQTDFFRGQSLTLDFRKWGQVLHSHIVVMQDATPIPEVKPFRGFENSQRVEVSGDKRLARRARDFSGAFKAISP
jgi:hypothetical protein